MPNQSPPQTNSDDKRRRYEKLYELAERAFWAEYERFDTAEQKANRYATLIVAVFPCILYPKAT